MNLSKDQVAASATPMVLQILTHGEDYGYSILKRITAASAGQIEWSEGLLYPLLHRLEHQGLITARWGHSPNGRRRKYYAITEEGRRELGVQNRQWEVLMQTLHTLGAPPSSLPSTPDPRPTI